MDTIVRSVALVPNKKYFTFENSVKNLLSLLLDLNISSAAAADPHGYTHKMTNLYAYVEETFDIIDLYVGLSLVQD